VHDVDEHAPLDELALSYRIYRDAIKALAE
jgi:acetylornithine deacetylase/succinyl-diaminopimelate desuccinylase-like protein